MGRADNAWRKRDPRSQTGPAHALTCYLRRATAAVASSVPGFAARLPRGASLLAPLALLLAALAFAAPAAAQTSTTLVSNTGKSTASGGGNSNNDHAQAFTTGSNSGGYKLTRVDIRFGTVAGTRPGYSVEIWSDSSGAPGSLVATLNNVASFTNGINQFNAPGTGIDLDASTTYHVFWNVTTTGNAGSVVIKNTASDDEDSGAAAGWSIADTSRFRNFDGSGAWASWAQSRQIAIVGYAKGATGPSLTSAAVKGTSLKLNYNEALDTSSVPDKSAFTVSVAGTDQTPTGVAVSGQTVTLTLGTAATAGQTVTVTYTVPNTNPIQNSAGNDAAALSSKAVTNVTGDSTSPTFSSAYVNGTELVVTFSEALDETSVPPPMSSFGVYLAGVGQHPTAVTIDGDEVTLTLGATVTAGQAVTVDYSLPVSGRIKDLAGNFLFIFGQQSVTNVTGDTAAPTLSSATVNGTSLRLNYNEALDTGSVPAATDFTVSVAGTDQTPTGVAVDGQTVTLTLGTAATAGQTVTVSYTKGTNPIRDLAGNDAANLGSQSVTNATGDTTAPTVSGAPSVTSNPGTDNTYAIGDTISVKVTFNEIVTVTGTPQLEIAVGTNNRQADYASGSGSTELVFSYTVVAGDADTDGISVGANKLTLNSGTIKDAADNDATLTHTALAAQSGHKVDTTKPTVSGAPSVTSNAGSDSTYTVGDTISVKVTFNENVTVTGTPQLEIAVGANNRQADYASGSGSTELIFSYTVVAGDADTDGISVGANKLALNGGTIKDAVGNDATLTHTALAAQSGHKVDTTAPTVSGAPSVTSNAGSDSTYAIGDTISVKVTFNENVTVTGTPRLEVAVGANNRQADYASGSGSTELTFSYTVASGDTDTDGISVGANKLTLNGGTITDGAGNNATLTHGALAAQSGHKVDGVAPRVSGGPSVTSDPGSDDTYIIGDTISVQVTFNENVTVTGTPRLEIAVGANNRPADYDSGSGTAELTFSYTVASGDSDADGIAVGDNKLALNSGTIKDGAGNNATLTHTALAAQSTHKVDGVAPTVLSATVKNASLKIKFRETLGAAANLANLAFAVKKTPDGGTETTVNLSSTAPSISGDTVTLTLAAAVVSTDTGVKVSYTKPGSGTNNKVVDAVGNEAASFTDQAVTITANSAPEFDDDTLTRSIAENTAANTNIGAVIPAATDDDNDTLTYTMEGTDAASFTFDASTRRIKTKTGVTYDFEAKSSYMVTIKADDGNGGTDTVGVTISLTDVNEPPAAPAAPAVAATSGSLPSLAVNWTAPDTTGKPDITDYDVRYQASGGTTWTSHSFTGTGTSTTISGLSANTIYNVQVKATNAEGSSGWSPSGSGNTGAPTLDNTVVNWTSLWLNYNEALDPGSVPATSAFSVSVAGTNQTPTAISVSGKTVRLTLGTAATAGQTVTVSYTVPGTNPIQDADGNDAAALSGQSVTNVTGETDVPTLDSAVVNRATLTLNYSEALRATSVPAAGSFTVSVAGTNKTPSNVQVSGSAVILTLATAVTSAQTVTVSYTVPSSNPIEDWAGNNAAALSGQAVTNQTPAVPSPTASATATPSATVTPGATVTLNGSASTAPPGATLTYAWSRTAGPAVTLNNAKTARASFTAPDSAVGTTLTFRLTVTATGGPSDGLTATDDVTLTVGDGPPRFLGGVGAMRLNPGEEMTPVTLPAATGGNGGPYSYALASAPADLAGLSFDAGTRQLSGTPEVEGSWTFTYTAHDGDGNTAASDAARLSFRVRVSTFSPERRRVVKRSLAAVAARTTASALSNIGTRLGDAVPAAGLTVAGQSVPLGAAGTAAAADAACPAGGFERAGFGRRVFGSGHDACAQGGRGRGVTRDQLLRTSAFSLALGAAEEGGGLDPREVHLSVWGRGDFGTFAGRPEPGMRYKGETRTGWLGIDARAGRWVAGLAASHGISEADYSFNGGGDPEDRGELETELRALYPYGRWTFENGLELRGLLGRGSGRLRHRPGGDDAPAEASDLTMWMASTGLRRKLPPVAGIDLSARGDVSVTRIRTAHGPTEIGGITAHSRRLRAGVEASRRFEAGSGRSYTPFLEVAARRDGGDGLTGTGLEMAGGLRHSAPGIHVELRGRWLAAYSQKGTEERGLSAIVRMQPKADGRGPSLTLSPRWGAGTGGARALWRDEMPKAGANAGAASGGNAASLDARTGYGFGVTPYGVVTPFAETGLSGGGDSRRLRLGTRFDAARMRLGVEVAGERRESVAAEPEHQFRLDARLRF